LWRYKLNEVYDNKNVWSIAFVEILEYLQGLLNVLINTNNPSPITDLKNAVLVLLTAIIYTNEQVAKKCNLSLIAKLW